MRAQGDKDVPFLLVESLNRHQFFFFFMEKVPFPLGTPQLTFPCVIQAVVGTVAHPALMDLHFPLEPKKGVGEVFWWDCVHNTNGTLNSHLGPLRLTVSALINKQITLIFPREGNLKEGF